MTITPIEAQGVQAAERMFLYRYRVVLTPKEPLKLPEYKGAALRGVFGHALRQVSCVIPDEDCALCPLRDECAYAVLFESMPPQGFPDAGKYQSFPRPYLINPPLSRQLTYAADEPLVFELVMVGRTAIYLPHVIYTFESLGQAGFGGRGRCEVTRVDALNAAGHEEVVYADGTLLGQGSALRFAEPICTSPQTIRATLHFMTPARLEIKGKLQDTAPEFAILMRSFLQRVALLSALYCNAGDPQQLIPQALLAQADDVRLVDADVSWREHDRYSSRQQSRLKQGGIVGTVVYHGHLEPFLPYLQLMQCLNIGKSTTFGLGRVALTLG